MAEIDKSVKVGSFTLPILPNTLSISREQIWSSNAGRNANGKFTGTLIATKYTISGTMRPLSDSEMKTYLTKVEKSDFKVSFWDPYTNQRKDDLDFYRATPTAKVYSYNSKLPRYVETSFEFIQI